MASNPEIFILDITHYAGGTSRLIATEDVIDAAIAEWKAWSKAATDTPFPDFEDDGEGWKKGGKPAPPDNHIEIHGFYDSYRREPQVYTGLKSNIAHMSRVEL